MDVLRLDPTTYLPNSLVEGYSSMIWTERHIENGEFEMKTAKIAETMALLPEETPITLLDSDEVMFVETHTIDVDDNGSQQLTVKGRTFETFLENRAMLAAVYREPWDTYKSYKTSELVSLLLWNHLVNPTNQDPSAVGKIKSDKTAVPGVVITDSTTLTETPKIWWLEEGQVYSAVIGFLQVGKLGIRNIRPKNTTGNVMSFDTSGTATRGNVSKVSTNNITSLRVDVHNGVDRTRFQSSVEPVIFHYDSGHIENPQYLFSKKDYKNTAIVSGDVGSIDVWDNPTNTEPTPAPTGLARRVLLLDAGDLGTLTYAEAIEHMVQKGQIELKKHNHATLFDGAISPISPYEYNKEYFLGDKVTLLGQYGFENSMIVAEYIRTEDNLGDRGYPTLILAS